MRRGSPSQPGTPEHPGGPSSLPRPPARHLHLGFQWSAAEWGSAADLWDTLFGWLGPRKVFWNLPAMPPGMPAESRAAVARRLRDRVESAGDTITAMGFAGAPHALLTIDELDREVSWGLRNPWSTGVTDTFGARPRILIPEVADLARTDPWKIYVKRGFVLVGLCAAPGDPLPRVTACRSVLRVRAATWPPDGHSAALLRHGLASSPDHVLLVDLSELTDLTRLRDLLEGSRGILAGNGASLASLPPPQGDSSPRPPGPPRQDWSAFSVPDLHVVLDETAALTWKRRKKSDEHAALLRALASRSSGRSPSERARPRPPLRLLAHMLGEVTLPGNSFEVLLHGGRFCGILRKGVQVLPARPAGSFFRCGRTVCHLRTVSSVSFETDEITGLREELGTDAAEGPAVSVEYFFPRDSEELTIVVEADFRRLPPVGPRLDEYAPLALVLRKLRRSETATIEARAPDGSTGTLEVSERCGSLFAPGAQHRIRTADGGWIVLTFSQPGGRAWGLPWFTIARRGLERFLEANLFGSAAPVATDVLAGRTAQFSVRLGLA